MERNRLDKIRRHAAARLIQASWKKYCFEKKQALNIYDDDDTNHSLRRVFILANQFDVLVELSLCRKKIQNPESVWNIKKVFNDKYRVSFHFFSASCTEYAYYALHMF